jgi:LAO/AO transport system kinase
VIATIPPPQVPAHVVGITGAPGAGKSTLTNQLVAEARQREETIAVLAVDPSSPFTGGAILGDRIRMSQHVNDPGVFIRSMAARSMLGGLALAVPAAVRALTAFGFDWVIVETVGVGQAEVDIVGQADTTLVVINPGWGDDIQASKAGLLEIADLYVVNKADRPGVRDTVRQISDMLELAIPQSWNPPVRCCIAENGEGVDAVWESIRDHRSHVTSSGSLEADRIRRRLRDLRSAVHFLVTREADAWLESDEAKTLLALVTSGELDPLVVANQFRACEFAIFQPS